MVLRLVPTARRSHVFSADDIARMVALGVHPGMPPRFTVAEYHRLIAAGVLGPSDKVELIAGEVVTKMAIGERHTGCVKRINKLFGARFGAAALIGIQDPVVLATSEPEPDVSLQVPRADDYSTGKPKPADLYLVLEVADSSLTDDLGWKAELYAENGVREYWVVDLVNDLVHVHRGPNADGTWATVSQYTRGDALAVAALPGASITVDDLLP